MMICMAPVKTDVSMILKAPHGVKYGHCRMAQLSALCIWHMHQIVISKTVYVLGKEDLQLSRDGDNTLDYSNFNALEVAETVDEECLGNKEYICTQLWQITATNVQCTTDGIFTDFSGKYS
eukprot:411095_1